MSRRPVQPESISPLRLRVSTADARRLLDERVKEGRELLNYFRNQTIQSTLANIAKYTASFRDEAKKWTDHNRDLILIRLFGNDERALSQLYNVSSHFSAVPHNPAASDGLVEKDVRRRIALLEGARDRIELYEAPTAQDGPSGPGRDVPRPGPLGKVVFIVHGHDLAARDDVAAHLRTLEVPAKILELEPNFGTPTVIEKLEEHAQQVGATIVLVTPDDPGLDSDGRARQNVVFELGYFLGKIGRRRVILLQRGKVEWLSDLAGAVYLPFDQEWKERLERELRALGLLGVTP